MSFGQLALKWLFYSKFYFKSKQFALFFSKISKFHFYDVRNTLEPFWTSFILKK